MQSHKQNFIVGPQKKRFNTFVGVFRDVFFTILKLSPYLFVVFVSLLLLLLIVLGVGILPYYASLKNVYSYSSMGQAHLLSAEALVREYDFSRAKTELTLAKEGFIEAQKSLSVLDKSFLLRSNFFHNQYDVANDVLFIGEKLAHAISGVCIIGERALSTLEEENLSFGKIDAQTKGELLGIMMESMNDIKDVRRDIGYISEKLRDINSKQPLFIFDKVVDPLQAKIPQIEKAFDSSLSFLTGLPWLTGYPEEKTYLFILENNREMRPSGGFIGTYGVLQLANAEIKNFYTDNSYNLDVLVKDTQKIPSPKPIKDYLGQQYWFFRDSNWWPDWPTSAQKVAWFYQLEGGKEKLDGVIAITPTVVEKLLGFLGEIEVDGLKFNEQNFWEQLEYQVEYGYYKQGIDAANRKDIIGDLSMEMIKWLYSYPMSEWPNLIETVSHAIKEKHILIYFFDPVGQSVAVKNGWAGEVKQSSGDYLMLVDANLGALKTDSVMSRTLVYNLNESKDGAVVSETKVNYQNMGTFSWKTTRYISYTRLYVPAGSQLLSVESGTEKIPLEKIDIYNEFGKTAFGLAFKVEPQTSKEIIWRYKLPTLVSDQIRAGSYGLLVQKQLGLDKLNLQLDLNFATKVKNVGESTLKNLQNIKQTSVLKQDEEFIVWFEKK